MFRNTYFKKFLLPGSLCATPIKASDREETACDPATGKLVRRSDLPIYGECLSSSDRRKDEEPGNLEKGISTVRKELWVWYDSCKGYRDKIVEVYDTGKEHTQVVIHALQQDELPIPRSGAIALSGLAGLVLGLRGGWVKRIFYGSAGAGLMAAVCYPKQVSELSQDALVTTKKYVMVTYNFIYGVKPEGLKLPSPAELLGGPVENIKEGKDDKSSSSTVSEKETPRGTGDKGQATKVEKRPNDQSKPEDKDLNSSRR